MGMLTRFRRRKNPYGAVGDEERMARYVYLLSTLPANVIESAHASAFADLPRAKRREMFEQLRPFMAEGERAAASDDPVVLARLIRRAEERRAERAVDGGGVRAASETTADPRDMMQHTGVMPVVAMHFLVSGAVHSYFADGAGAQSLDSQPDWVGEIADHGVGESASGGGFDMGGFGGFDLGGIG